jgi:gamma-glutamyl:cysteine ligase YbdK (ATP-grasp superfamily)
MVDIERARQRFAARARKHATSVDVERLARIRTDGLKGKPQRRLSEAAGKHLEAKLERLRAAGPVNGVRRVRRVTKGAGEG